MKFWSKKYRNIENEILENSKKLESKIFEFNSKSRLIEDKIEKKVKELEIKEKNIISQTNDLNEKINVFKSIYNETFQSISWLTDKYADFQFLLESSKIVFPKFKRNANCSEAQKEFAKENKKLRKRNIELEIQLKQIQNLLPDFDDIIEENIDIDLLEDVNVETEDKINFLVSDAEQIKLSKQEILQLALNKYIQRKKTNSAIGKEYERYIGHLYEEKGYSVEYHGIKYGFEDLGIDLICTKKQEVLLIQCKYWKKSSSIKENAINQLFGTSIKYFINNYDNYQETFKNTLFQNSEIPFSSQFQPIFITTTKLTDTATEFAKILKIKILEIPFEKDYPRIKCNIGKDIDGNQTKIYHLPFDQQYDKVQNLKNGGFNANTIIEAESKGYRKAFRWQGE